jgi:hypothetical protein
VGSSERSEGQHTHTLPTQPLTRESLTTALRLGAVKRTGPVMRQVEVLLEECLLPTGARSPRRTVRVSKLGCPVRLPWRTAA